LLELLQVTLFWGSFEYLLLLQKEKWSFSKFFSNLGGSLGVWLGLSVLSLVQVVKASSQKQKIPPNAPHLRFTVHHISAQTCPEESVLPAESERRFGGGHSAQESERCQCQQQQQQQHVLLLPCWRRRIFFSRWAQPAGRRHFHEPIWGKEQEDLNIQLIYFMYNYQKFIVLHFTLLEWKES
jgi:hypothetical protein